MVILLKQHAPQAEQERLLAWLRELGAEVRVTGTPERPFFCLTGDISRIDPSLAARFPAVEDVLRLTEPYPLCSRRLHPEPTVVSVGGARFGGGNFGLIAGPCAVESEEQIFTAARQAKAAGVCLLRVFWVTVVVSAHHELNVLLLSYPITWIVTSSMFMVYYLRGRWLKRCIALQNAEN